jgi:hypothetical protein
VELFFKWIKQHLRIKAFYGTSENAVKTQIWIAVSVYVLVAIGSPEGSLIAKAQGCGLAATIGLRDQGTSYFASLSRSCRTA